MRGCIYHPAALLCFRLCGEPTPIDADKESEMASKYGIIVVPTLILKKNGKELNKRMGVTSREELTEALDAALK